MKETDTTRYFRFLKRLFWLTIPAVGLAIALDMTWAEAPDLPRLLGMAALVACILASITTYRSKRIGG